MYTWLIVALFVVLQAVMFWIGIKVGIPYGAGLGADAALAYVEAEVCMGEGASKDDVVAKALEILKAGEQ